jgi:hypothetical protein
MKRKILLFVAVLIVMLLVKYALGQEGPTGIEWAPGTSDPTDDILELMAIAPLAGVGFAIIRALSKRISRPVLEPLRLD